MKKAVLVYLFLVFTIGCVQMRDYVGTKEGAFGVDMRQGFDEGVDRKDYYVIRGGEGLVIGDTKKEVIAKIGLADEVSLTLDKYEQWTYYDRNLNLYFKGDKLNNFSLIE